MTFVRRLERRLSGKQWRNAGDGLSLLFFFIFIIAPVMSIFLTVLRNWGDIYQTVFADPFFAEVGKGSLRWDNMQTALLRSFEIAGVVAIIDVMIGLPMALILARYDFRGKRVLDTLVDLPLAVPTAALGFSIYLFWGTMDGIGGLLGLQSGLFSRGPFLIILTHVAFSYPYIVRSLKEIIASVDVNIEYAARTLGAPSFTVFRTITAPLIKNGIIAGSILSFTRSLGETGATLIVAGAFYTSPILVVEYRQLLMIQPAAFLSMILIIVSVFLLACLRFSAERFGLPIKGFCPNTSATLVARYREDSETSPP